MVHPKAKPPPAAAAAAAAARALEDRRASKNLADFKIYSRGERGRSLAGGVDMSRKSMGKPPPAVTRKSVPAGTFAKPAAQAGRKALADVSNAGSYPPRNRLSEIPKPMKDRPEGNIALQGTLNGVKNSSGLLKNKDNLRVPLTKSVAVANAASRKPIGGLIRGKENMACDTSSVTGVKNYTRGERGKSLAGTVQRCGDSSRMSMGRPLPTVTRKSVPTGASVKSVAQPGRKSLVRASNTKNTQSSQLKNRLSDNPYPMKDRLAPSVVLQGKRNSVGNSRGPSKNKAKENIRVSLTKSIVVASAASRKPSTVLHAKTKSETVPIAQNASVESKEELPTRSDCDGTSVDIRQDCGPENSQVDDSCCSSETVTAVISRPKCRRRRSYTSTLMARSKLIGRSADLLKKDELPNIDDNANPLEAAEYVDDIYQYYWTMEALNPSLANYMTIQSEVTPRMRGILINWLIEVHFKFELMQETLFLMVELLDRVLSMSSIEKNDLQMVGLTTLLLASKYEDFWHPKIDELISISVNSFSREQMLTLERQVLTKLRYRLNIPTPYVFMLRFLKAAQCDKKVEDLAFYLIELCLVEYEALRFRPSMLCASAIYVARCTLNILPSWTDLLGRHTRYEESQLRDCAGMILRFQRAAGQKPVKFTYKKFLNSDRSGVAAIEPLDKLPRQLKV